MPDDFYAAQQPTLLEFFGPLAIHVVLLLLALTAVGGLMLRRNRPARMYDTFLWLGCGLVITLVFLTLTVGQRDVEIFVASYVMFVWCITLIGMGLSFYRLFSSGNATELGVTVSALAFLCVLITCLLPSTPHAREAARRTQCKNYLKQIGLAFHNYHDQFNSFPMQQIGGPPQSWRVMMLPRLGEVPLFLKYRRDQAWDSLENAEFSKMTIHGYQCPSQMHLRDDQGRFLTSYSLLSGPDAVWRDDGPLPLEKFQDGTSNTIMVVEACGMNIIWNEPRDIDLTTTPIAVNLPGKPRHHSPAMVSSLHKGGGNVLFADGTIRFISQTIDPKVLQALTTARGGEPVGDF